MEDITAADYADAKRVFKDFEIKDWENIMICTFKAVYNSYLIYSKCLYDLETLCLKIYELDPAKFLSALAWAWQAALKKD